MPLESKENNQSIFFNPNKVALDIYWEIGQLQTNLNVKRLSLKTLQENIQKDKEFLIKSEKNSENIDILNENILKLKFVMAALEKKIDCLQDPVILKIFSAPDHQAFYKCGIRVSKDVKGVHKKSKDFLTKQKNILLELVKSRFKKLTEESVSISDCDKMLLELKDDKLKQECIIAKFRSHLSHMEEVVALRKDKISEIHHQIKNLELEYYFQSFFKQHNQTQPEQSAANKISIRNINPF